MKNWNYINGAEVGNAISDYSVITTKDGYFVYKKGKKVGGPFHNEEQAKSFAAHLQTKDPQWSNKVGNYKTGTSKLKPGDKVESYGVKGVVKSIKGENEDNIYGEPLIEVEFETGAKKVIPEHYLIKVGNSKVGNGINWDENLVGKTVWVKDKGQEWRVYVLQDKGDKIYVRFPKDESQGWVSKTRVTSKAKPYETANSTEKLFYGLSKDAEKEEEKSDEALDELKKTENKYNIKPMSYKADAYRYGKELAEKDFKNFKYSNTSTLETIYRNNTSGEDYEQYGFLDFKRGYYDTYQQMDKKVGNSKTGNAMDRYYTEYKKNYAMAGFGYWVVKDAKDPHKSLGMFNDGEKSKAEKLAKDLNEKGESNLARARKAMNKDDDKEGVLDDYGRLPF